MLSTLATADTVTWLAIFVKAGAYFASLLAAGSVLVLLGLRTLPASARRRVVWTAFGAAVFAVVLSLLRIPLQASFLTGGLPQGASDPRVLRMVFDSPLGDAIMLRLIGLGLICAALLSDRRAQWIAGGGAVLVAASFAMRGHTLEEPRLLLGSLITVHLLGLAFWIGALAPLAR
ncbi:MAG: copper-binding protein, partial [Rhodobacteraceae bacterium]|nr:copper-binding protein [Paracoccaceae bacterium]